MLTAVDVVTAFVATVATALEEPAGTVTLPGTVATDVLLEERFTTTPPAGAATVSFTIAADELPPASDEGESVTADSARTTGLTVSDAVFVTPA